MYRLI